MSENESFTIAEAIAELKALQAREAREVDGLPLIETSGSVGKLAKALAAFQGECPAVPLNGFNPFFKSRYALLEDVLSTATPLTGKHGLSFVQLPNARSGGQKPAIYLLTQLQHESGEWIRTVSKYEAEKSGSIQAIKAATTYAKSNELCAILGIAGGDDDDGESTEGRVHDKSDKGRGKDTPPAKKEPAKKPSARKQAKEEPPPPSDEDAPSEVMEADPTEEQMAQLLSVSKELGLTRDARAAICKKVTGKATKDINGADADMLLAHFATLLEGA